MGEGDKRQPQRILRNDSRELERAKPAVPRDVERDDKRASPAPKDAEAAALSRTATLDDPLTTSLLAEVARRSMTIEVSPAQVNAATELASDDDPAADWADDPRRDPA